MPGSSHDPGHSLLCRGKAPELGRLRGEAFPLRGVTRQTTFCQPISGTRFRAPFGEPKFVKNYFSSFGDFPAPFVFPFKFCIYSCAQPPWIWLFSGGHVFGLPPHSGAFR